MQIFWYTLFGIVALLSVILLIAILKPSNFSIERSVTLSVPPSSAFPFLVSLKKFQEWSPYRDKDSKATYEFTGPEIGIGSTMHWRGNANVGEGIMKIIDIRENESVEIELQFIRPFPGINAVIFSLQPQDKITIAKWTMKGNFALIPKIFGMFINIQKMIGNDFQAGLEKLKKLVENN